MSLAQAARRCALIAPLLGAVVVAGCGASSKPVAGTISPTSTTVGRAKLDDPRPKHVKCLRQDAIPVAKVGRTWLQIGTAPTGPVVNFLPTPGAAQEAQISGEVQGAEVIGSSLLFPRQASDKLLQKVEDCLAEGVKG